MNVSHDTPHNVFAIIGNFEISKRYDGSYNRVSCVSCYVYELGIRQSYPYRFLFILFSACCLCILYAYRMLQENIIFFLLSFTFKESKICVHSAYVRNIFFWYVCGLWNKNEKRKPIPGAQYTKCTRMEEMISSLHNLTPQLYTHFQIDRLMLQIQFNIK